MEREARGVGLRLRKRGYSRQVGEGGITPHCLGEGDHPRVANLVVQGEAEIEMAREGEGERERWGEGGVCEK